MCGENSKNFCCITTLWILGLFVTSLLNMIFLILNPKDYKGGYDEMNSDVNKNKNLLMGLGIACFSFVAFNIVFIIPAKNTHCFDCECSDKDCDCPECGCGDHDCCWLCICCCQCFNCCLFFKQTKRFFNEFLPSFILSLISFILTISKMKIYNKYSKKRYDDDDDFKKSKSYNLDMFICLLIYIIITVLYPIIVLMVTTKNNDNLLISKIYKTNNTKNIPRNNIQYEPIMYVPPYNIVNNPQNNLQYSPNDIQAIPPYYQ